MRHRLELGTTANHPAVSPPKCFKGYLVDGRTSIWYSGETIPACGFTRETCRKDHCHNDKPSSFRIKPSQGRGNDAVVRERKMQKSAGLRARAEMKWHAWTIEEFWQFHSEPKEKSSIVTGALLRTMPAAILTVYTDEMEEHRLHKKMCRGGYQISIGPCQNDTVPYHHRKFNALDKMSFILVVINSRRNQLCTAHHSQ